MSILVRKSNFLESIKTLGEDWEEISKKVELEDPELSKIEILIRRISRNWKKWMGDNY